MGEESFFLFNMRNNRRMDGWMDGWMDMNANDLDILYSYETYWRAKRRVT